MQKVQKTDTCWLWMASKSPNGYGHVKIAKIQGGAHRFMWLMTFGPIPDGLCVLHRCDVKHCVNPDHLWLGTRGDNWRDCIKKGRHNCGAKGEAQWKAKLTVAQVKEIRARHKKGLGCALAREFDVNSSVIWRIVHNRIWRSIL